MLKYSYFLFILMMSFQALAADAEVKSEGFPSGATYQIPEGYSFPVKWEFNKGWTEIDVKSGTVEIVAPIIKGGSTGTYLVKITGVSEDLYQKAITNPLIPVDLNAKPSDHTFVINTEQLEKLANASLEATLKSSAEGMIATHVEGAQVYDLVCQAETLTELYTFRERDLNFRLKGKEDLATYIDCYKSDQKSYDSYLNEYKGYFEAAAKAYGLPEAYLTCAVFVENKFRNGTSPKGATGPCQFTPATISDFSALLNNKPIDDAEVDRRLAEAQTAKDVDVALARTRYELSVVQRDLHHEWKEYFDLIGKTPPSPLGVSSMSRMSVCVGAAAWNLKSNMRMLDHNYHHDFRKKEIRLAETEAEPQTAKEISSNDFLLLAGAAYNAGVGSVKRRILGSADEKGPRGSSLSEWKGLPEQTYKHMIRIRNCMEPGWEAPDDAGDRACGPAAIPSN